METSLGPTFTISTHCLHTFVQAWHDVLSALHAVTTAVLHTSPRATAVKQTLIFLLSHGSKQPSLKLRVLRPLLCSSPTGTLSVTTTSSAVQLPLFVTVIA